MSLRSPNHYFAVIDIGSNSVRMVIYHALTRVPVPVFNEKYYCGLGTNLRVSGVLHPEGVALAHAALGRFALMLERFSVTHCRVIATAAVREAEDGKAFVKAISKAYGLECEVITGKREAYLAAMGVISVTHHARGIVADMGGGSLELAAIEDGQVHKQVSLPLGVLSLLDEGGRNPSSLKALISDALASIKWLHAVPNPMIYAVGGSFRAMAKLHIRQSNYPLDLVHEYHVSKRAVAQMQTLFATDDLSEIESLPGIPTKRAATMLPASVALQTLMDHCSAQQVTFSVSGIREGLLYDALDAPERQEDPLLASARDLASLLGRKGRYASELMRWTAALFPEEKPERTRLREAACLLSELAWTVDPNYRAEWAYQRVLHSSMKGLTHRERVMLAIALYHRYQSKWKLSDQEAQILDDEQRLWSHVIGLACSVAFHLTGGQSGYLHHAQLVADASGIVLELDEEANPLLTETVEKKLEGLGSTFKALSNFVI